MRQSTPTLIEAIDAIVNRHLCEVHTSLPCEIVSYDYGKNLASVKPTLKRKYKSEDNSVELPIISNVPIAFQRMGDGHLRIPINPGDTGQLIFNERSIDGWLVSGGTVDPQDPRKHSLSDAVFYPGLAPSNKPISSSAAPDSVELKLKDSYIEVLSSGKFKITDGTEELFDLLVQTLAEISKGFDELGNVHTTNTIFGPQKPVNFGNYTAIKALTDALKTKFESLKG